MLHRQLKCVTLTLLALGKIGEKYDFKPLPRLIALEKEIAEEEADTSKSVPDKPSKSTAVDSGEKRSSDSCDSIDREVRPFVWRLLNSIELPVLKRRSGTEEGIKRGSNHFVHYNQHHRFIPNYLIDPFYFGPNLTSPLFTLARIAPGTKLGLPSLWAAFFTIQKVGKRAYDRAHSRTRLAVFILLLFLAIDFKALTS